ncbi:MAG: TonB-dependent receptor, partial [Bacteroidetes bacterium]|nr:TonB-dependent receptor [Bacteroidota bacterium]
MKKFTIVIVLLVQLIHLQSGFTQVTTSGITGIVMGSNKETLPGASVMAIHQPTGTNYQTTTDIQGYYHLPNVIVGGPYKLTISFIGYETCQKTDIYLNLGQTSTYHVTLNEKAAALKGIEIIARKYDMFDGNRTGAETYIGTNAIKTLPTIDRSLNDLFRLTPQASIVGGGVTIAGVNNRYNSIFVDGAVNNDVFGLSSSGTNGGQLGITPFSTDAIDEFQVAVAPYDVKLSGFAGAGINAVTRRGTNEIKGSAYYFMRNENLTGKKPSGVDSLRKKADPFTAQTYGLSLGGPIIRDKFFFFINAEQQRDEIPTSYSLADYQGNSKNHPDSLTLLEDKIRSYGYEPGKYVNPSQTTKSDKFLIRLDYNLGKKHRLTLRHSYTKGVSVYPYEVSGPVQLVYNANWINFTSVTNSTAFEVNSMFSNRYSNNFIIGYTSVHDDRDPNGANFPYVKITDGAGKYIIFGSERYSSANDLKQNILTITDNVEINQGKHTITIGTHNEFYKMYNLFIRESFGRYNFANISQFINGLDKATYSHSYSLVDNVTGDGSKAAADFNAMQLGIYVQDEWKVTRKLSFTGGIRFDIPMFRDNPIEIPQFDTTLAKMEEAGYDLKGAKSGSMPASQPMVSPRIGFNYDPYGNQKTQVRGGVGIFTSRIPFVWPAGAYSNNGMIIGGLSITRDTVAFNPNPDTQYTAESIGLITKKPSGEINLFARDFKYPQVFRASLAVDQKLPWWGLIGSTEIIYTKTLNNIILYNLNIRPSTVNLSGGQDTRPIYGSGGSVNLIEPRYSGVYLIDNTSNGRGYN